MHSVVVHGHFYQPPREDPWTDQVDPEPTAAPFQNWNERITSECYAPFASARVLDPKGQVADRVNLYEWVSYNIGSTLARWLEAQSPDVYHAILGADRSSARRLGGHGNAIAMPYHHVILPLASRRDKVTEVRWGLEDFRTRFGREPEGMWLPETAVDEESLVVLAEEGVRFTILAPHQVVNPSPIGEPLRFAAGGGREIAIFTYDGAIAADAAFGPLLQDGDEFARRLALLSVPVAGSAGAAAGDSLTVTSLALDGETFGHHKKFAEMALAEAVVRLRKDPGVIVENYASLLARVPPRDDAQLIDRSSWSCPHGVERWRSGCPCGNDPLAPHGWRRPLRAALNWLAREFDARHDSGATPAFGDAWGARQGMFGSCAWFFDDAAGHETVLMLRSAAYVLGVLGDEVLEREFLVRLALAKSEDPALGDAARAYRAQVLPLRPARAP